MKSPFCRAGADGFFWTGYIPETEAAWRTLVGDPPEARDFTHDIRVLEGSLFAVAHWSDGLTYWIPTLLAAFSQLPRGRSKWHGDTSIVTVEQVMGHLRR